MRTAIATPQFSKYDFDTSGTDNGERGCSAGGGHHAESFSQGCALLINGIQKMLTRLWSARDKKLQTKFPLQQKDMLHSIYSIFCRVLMQRYQGVLSESEVDEQGLKEHLSYNGKLLSALHIKNRIQSAVRKECDDMINHYRYPIRSTTLRERHLAQDFQYQTTTTIAEQSSEDMVQALQQLIDVADLLEAKGDSPELLSPDDGISEIWVILRLFLCLLLLGDFWRASGGNCRYTNRRGAPWS